MRVRVITDAGGHDIDAGDAGAAVAAGAGLVWVDIDHADGKGMALLSELVDVRQVDVEDCHRRTPVPKLHLYSDHHYTAINGLARGVDGRLYFQPLKIFQSPRLVVTVLGPTSSALSAADARRELDSVHSRIDEHEFRPSTSLDIITAVRREMMSTLEMLIADAAGRIADFERKIAHADPVKSERLLDELFALRHDLQTIRTSAAQAQQTYTNLLETAEMESGGTADRMLLAVDERRVAALRRGFGHIVQTTDLEREYLQEMLDLFQTRVSTELNRFVRRVTAWGTIGIAWTVITGLYGMNVVGIPGIDAPWGFAAIVAVMVAVAVGLGVFFHRHGWL